MDYSKIFTVDYFILKFSTIPDRLWTTGKYAGEQGTKCAYGHCGLSSSEYIPEAAALTQLFQRYLDVNPFFINDGHMMGVEAQFITGNTPKQRILNALKRIKLLQQQAQTTDTIINKALCPTN